MLLSPSMDSPLANSVPCVVTLNMPDAGPRIYGPFINMIEAMNWIDAIRVQFPYMNLMIQPLRRPDRDRYSSQHWFGREENDLEGFIDDLMPIQDWRNLVGETVRK